MLPIFNKRIITDGDNVESEDFDQPEPKRIPAKPFPYRKLSAEEKKARDWYYMTEEEKRRIEDEYLASKGII